MDVISKLKDANLDIVKEILSNLNYEEITKFCNENNEFLSVYNDGYFWQNKILKEYQSTNLNEIKINQMKSKYLMLLAIELDKKAEEMEYNKPKIVTPIKFKGKTYQIKGESDEWEIAAKIDNLKDKATKYFQLAEIDLPVIYDYKLIPIYLTRENLTNLSLAIYGSMGKIKIEKYLLNINYMIRN